MLKDQIYLRSVKIDTKVDIDFNAYPFNIAAVKNMQDLKFDSQVTFFVGENGSGKSTILESIALALGFSAEGGTRNFSLRTTAACASELYRALKISRGILRPKDGYFLRAESFYNVATYMDEVGYLNGYKGSLHARSHGEAFMAVLLHKLTGEGLYLFDEPEAALSVNNQLAMLCIMHELVNNKSQFIISTHSPILLAYPNAKILRFDKSGIEEISYEETDSYVLTKSFLNNHSRNIEKILL
jgi:predicted ATPase